MINTLFSILLIKVSLLFTMGNVVQGTKMIGRERSGLSSNSITRAYWKCRHKLLTLFYSQAITISSAAVYSLPGGKENSCPLTTKPQNPSFCGMYPEPGW